MEERRERSVGVGRVVLAGKVCERHLHTSQSRPFAFLLGAPNEERAGREHVRDPPSVERVRLPRESFERNVRGHWTLLTSAVHDTHQNEYRRPVRSGSAATSRSGCLRGARVDPS